MSEPVDTSASNVSPASATQEENAQISAIAHALDDWYTHLGRQFGPLSRPQRRMLHFIGSKAQTRVSDLAERLGLTTAGATRMLDTLEAQGYATRARVPQKDQRQVYVTLTPAGEEALRLADEMFLGRIAEMAQRLNVDERGELARLLRAMNGNERASE